MSNGPLNNTFRILLIQPSRYDDEGYVIHFRRVHNAPYTLAAIHGLLLDAIRRMPELAEAVVEIRPLDENSQIIPVAEQIAWLREGARALVMIVGVQTAQFPRAVDLAAAFTRVALPAIIGGFHVSAAVGVLAGREAFLQPARAVGAALFAGEFEGAAAELLGDAWRGELKPLYNSLEAPPVLGDAPPPFLDPSLLGRSLVPVAGVELGRGCPYTCSFCCIINVYGNKYRSRGASQIADHLRRCNAMGIRRYTFVDDNLARNPEWRKLFAIMGDLRQKEGQEIDFFMQVDARSHQIPGFVAAAKTAGCSRIFIGVESVSGENLDAVNKRSSSLAELRDMALAWRGAGIMVTGGYIIGLPNDTPQSVAADIRAIQRETAIDGLHLNLLTPLPGSMDHRDLLVKDVELDADFNLYDGTHAVVDHPHMTRAQWERLYRDAWGWLHSLAFAKTTFRRALISKTPVRDMFGLQLVFGASMRLDGLPPLQGGFGRVRARTDRRPGLPLEPAWRFYPRQALARTRNILGWITHFLRLHLLLLQARIEARWFAPIDPALTPGRID